MARFLQIHTLSSYPGTLLNRDDAGFAKRLPFGGAVRTRISSQCLKRHWRTFDGPFSLGAVASDPEAAASLSIRSRLTFERHILGPLRKDCDEQLARFVTAELMANVLGAKEETPNSEESESSGSASQKKREGKAKDSSEAEPEALRSKQVTTLGRVELEALLGLARELVADDKSDKKLSEQKLKELKKVTRKKLKEQSENLKALRLGAGLDAALFGRMVTGDILSRVDAAVHVAHAFTVHREASEADWFTAVDELQQEDDDGELGAGHLNTTELTSGIFYGYVVVDNRGLLNNLSGDSELAAEITRRLVRIIAEVSPGAKRGSTAPYAKALFVLLEAGDEQPRTLANAFLAPVRAEPDLLANTYTALRGFIGESDGLYGSPGERKLAGLGPLERLGPALADVRLASIRDLADWAAERISVGAAVRA